MAQNIADATGVINLDEEKHPFLSRVLNGKGLADVYRMGMDIQDSAAVAGLTAIHPALGQVGSVMLSSSAGTQAMLDAVQRGATDEQALTVGVFSGFFELFFEKFGVKKLLNADSHIVNEMSTKMLNEFVGGSSTEFSKLATDYLIMAKNSNYEQSIEQYLAENPTWSYEQAVEQALIDYALQIVEAGVGKMISERVPSLTEESAKKALGK